MHKKILIITLMLLIASMVYAERPGRMTITDREIIERLTRLEEGQKALNQRMNTIENLMWVLLAGMFVLIGFVIWDRRTALSPVIKRTKEIERENDKVIEVLKEYAKGEPKLASILKSFGML